MERLIFFLLTYAFFINKINAQKLFSRDVDTNYYSISSKLKQNPIWEEDSANESGIFVKHNRWQRFWDDRIGANPSMKYIDSCMIQNINTNISTLNRNHLHLTSNNWQPVGPFGRVNDNNASNQHTSGNGQINGLFLDPLYPNILYAYSYRGGGLWKGLENSQGLYDWVPISDKAPFPGCSAATITHKSGSEYVFMASYLDGFPIGHESYGYGVYRMINGGQFFPVITGMPIPIGIYELRVNPNNPDEMFAATDKGIYKTSDATTNCTWTNLFSGLISNEMFRAIEFQPGNTQVLYASGNDIYKSINGGVTWQSILRFSQEFQSQFTSIPININITTTSQVGHENELYASIIVDRSNNNQCIWKYDGQVWAEIGRLNPTGPERVAISVMPINNAIVYAGNVFLYSTNSVCGWDAVGGSSNLHVDIHDLLFDSMNRLIIACDGGVYRLDYPDIPAIGCGIDLAYTDLSNGSNLIDGLQVGTIYSMGTNAIDPDVIIVGEQDCGDNYTLNASQQLPIWSRVFRGNFTPTWWDGDGGQCLVDNVDSKKMYASSVYNYPFLVTTDGWTDQQYLKLIPRYPSGNLWSFCPHRLSPDNKFYAVGTDLWKWDELSNSYGRRVSNFISDYAYASCIFRINSVAFAPSNDKKIIVGARIVENGTCSSSFHIFKSESGGGENIYPGVPKCLDGTNGVCWQEITPTQFQLTETVSGIAVSSEYEDHIYFTCSGFNPNQKVFKSINNGVTWINISYGLPNYPVNCIVYEKGTDGQIYIGTDAGVYYINNRMLSSGLGFQKYDSNIFPNCIVTSLAINYSANKIRAGTWGRGVWESTLICPDESQLYLTGPVSSNKYVEVTESIFSNEEIINGHIIYRAGETIDLFEDFNVIAGVNTEFYALIHGCDKEGSSIYRRNIYGSKEYEAVLEEDVNVFPNPSTGVFYLDAKLDDGKDFNIEVISMLGSIVLRKEGKGAKLLELDLSGYPEGVYLVKCSKNAGISFKKTVKIQQR